MSGVGKLQPRGATEETSGKLQIMQDLLHPAAPAAPWLFVPFVPRGFRSAHPVINSFIRSVQEWESGGQTQLRLIYCFVCWSENLQAWMEQYSNSC